METTVEALRDSLKESYDMYYESRNEAQLVEEMYHNRQYSDNATSEILSRGQPLETYNIFKKYTRLLSGYFETVSNNIKITPRQPEYAPQAEAMQSVLKYILEDNHYNNQIARVKMDGMLTGLMALYVDVKPSTDEDGNPKYDSFGRPEHRVVLEHVPSNQLFIDFMSYKPDYSDARFIHRFKWVSREYVIKTWGKEQLENLESKYNSLDVAGVDYENTFRGWSHDWHNQGYYLIIHSVVEDDDEKVWSIYWSNDHELERKEVTYKNPKFPYLLAKLIPSNVAEYYGIFHEVIESQKAINQSITKLQLMSTVYKFIVEEGAVESEADFERASQSVASMIGVKDIKKVTPMDLTSKSVELYQIIEHNIKRINEVMGINLSFQGTAAASDSGRKVKLQQQSSALSMRYMISAFEELARITGEAIISLVKQYYQAHQVLSVVDENSRQAWVEINRPFVVPMDDGTGNIVEKVFYEPIIDPATNKPLRDDAGNMLMAPEPEIEADIRLGEYQLSIDTVNTGMEDDVNQIITNMTLNGQIGQALLQANPGRFFEMGALTMKTVPTKYARQMAELLQNQAAELGIESTGANPAAQTTGTQAASIPGDF